MPFATKFSSCVNSCKYKSYGNVVGAVHTSNIDRSEINLDSCRAKCRQSKTSQSHIKIDLNKTSSRSED